MRAIALLASLVAATVAAFWALSRRSTDDQAWTDQFAIEPGELAAAGANPYFILQPGYQLVLRHGADELVITVLEETKLIDGVETRVVEERESEDGELVEVSRNYFAISRRTNDVYYFGEDVDNYRDGVVADHEGAWLAGRDGARMGLMMPGQPLLGARHYQEIAPGIAMDRAHIVSLDASLDTPAGDLRRLLRVAETTPLEPGLREYKLYARGIGLVQDGALTLVSYGSGPARPQARTIPSPE